VVDLSITKRYIYALAAGIPFVALGLLLNNSLTIFIIYNLICAIILAVDYMLTEDEANIHIRRIGQDSLSIYEKESISFEVFNSGNRKLYIELKDEMPEFHFNTEGNHMKGEVQPKEKKIFSYAVEPTKRGAFLFKTLHVKYEGKLRLCMKLFKIRLDRDYKVYPNLKNLRKYRLSITNNRMFRQGKRSLKMLGRGSSFESLREYVYGDEYRKINWSATARAGKPILNQYEPEKNQHVYMIIDTGRPMSYTVRGYRKLDLVVNTALILSDVVNQNDDKSGLLIFNTGVSNMIMPGKGAGHRNKILEALYHLDYTKDTSNYDEAFFHLKKKERHRSIMFLFTDFDTVEEAENMMKVLPVISRGNVVVLILIKDERLEAIAGQKLKNSKDIFDRGVAVELLEERRKIMEVLNRRGVLCVECPAEKIEYTVINKYIQVKNKNA
jgi:uncharacterized protein (DUF58 family)